MGFAPFPTAPAELMERILLHHEASGARVRVDLETETEAAFHGMLLLPKPRGGWHRIPDVRFWKPYWSRVNAP